MLKTGYLRLLLLSTMNIHFYLLLMFLSKDLTGEHEHARCKRHLLRGSSLHATFLRNHIISAFRAAGEPDIQNAASLVDQNIVYKYPTIKQLAALIVSIISTKDAGSRVAQQTQLMTGFIAKYAADLPTLRPTEETPKEDIVVFLTGSTGSIGSYILASLLADARVAKVYAFNRASRSQADRHLASFEDRGLPKELLNGHKYASLVGDLNLDDFGLSGDVFKEVSLVIFFRSHGLVRSCHEWN